MVIPGLIVASTSLESGPLSRLGCEKSERHGWFRQMLSQVRTPRRLEARSSGVHFEVCLRHHAGRLLDEGRIQEGDRRLGTGLGSVIETCPAGVPVSPGG